MEGANIRARAEDILNSIKNDMELIPPDFKQWWSNYLNTHYTRYIYTILLLEQCEQSGKILEIGCLPGHLIILLKLLGHDVHGVDIAPNRANLLWEKYNVNIEKVDIEQDSLPFPAETFDTVLFVEILEHLRLNPLHALREAHRVLKINGRIIVSTPNITLRHRIDFLKGRSYQGNPVEEFKKLERIGHMGHIRLYTSEEVKRFLEHSGFTICFTSYSGQIPGRLVKLVLALLHKKGHFHKYLHVVAKRV